jgi:serine/threonine protein phosphatase 1
MRTYAIGDIHGHLDLLQAQHALIEADRGGGAPGDLVVHVGDLVDRGANSRGVVEYLMQGIARGAPWAVIKGNHDRLFTWFLADPARSDPGLRPDLSWLHPRLGGAETLMSYGVHAPADRPVVKVHADAVDAVPIAHRRFLESRPASLLRGEVLFVHAGIRPGIDLTAQNETDLVWIRKDFLEDDRDHGALVVHGHTAIDRVTHYGNRLNLDSGAAYGGPLTTVVIEGREVWHLTPRGRVPVVPERLRAA